MIILVTGTPGSGKTLFVVSKILELKKQFSDRKIYADIDDLQIDDVEKSPEDWRDTPDNSIVIYDEAQQHERFRAGTNANKDEIVQKLQVHRHTGHDIWFITQSPRFLNAFVLDLVGEHYHLHRPYGAKLASVYYWRSVRKQPQSLSSKELAENEFLFKYPKDLFDYYKSATQHNVKFKFPKKLLYVIGGMLLCAGIVLKMIYSDGTQKMINGTLGASDNTQKVVKNAAASPASNAVSPASNAASIQTNQIATECRKAENLNKPECVAWFDQLTKTGQSVQAMDNPAYSSQAQAMQQVSYNAADPYNDKDIKSKLQYQVTSQPKFSGCMKTKNGYHAYTEQGTYLKASKSVCNRLMNDSADRPYNYFKQPEQAQLVQQNINTQIDSSQDNQTAKNQDDFKSTVSTIEHHPVFKETDITKPSI